MSEKNEKELFIKEALSILVNRLSARGEITEEIFETTAANRGLEVSELKARWKKREDDLRKHGFDVYGYSIKDEGE